MLTSNICTLCFIIFSIERSAEYVHVSIFVFVILMTGLDYSLITKVNKLVSFKRGSYAFNVA